MRCAQRHGRGKVIDHLRQHPRPVDRIDPRQPHPVAKGEIVAPQIALKRILVALSSSLLCVDTWTNLAPEWQNRDATRGKTYSLPDGRTVVAQHITEEGHLFWMSETDSGITTLAEASYS